MLVTAIYATYPWHSRSSMELIGIATTEKQRDRLIRQYLNQYLYEKPTREQISRAIKEVQENGQTHSLSDTKANLEIYTETFKTNVVL